MLRDSEAHTETEFSVVFEEGVRPSGTAAFLVLCPRSGRQVTAVNGGMEEQPVAFATTMRSHNGDRSR